MIFFLKTFLLPRSFYPRVSFIAKVSNLIFFFSKNRLEERQTMSNFTTAQLAQFQKELTEAFHYHDKDSDGKIPAKVSTRGWRASQSHLD